MEYWVDGYNLILRKGWNTKATLQQARDRLLSAVTGLGVTVRVFFDASKPGAGGLQSGSPSTRVVVTFVRDRSADDAIADALRAAPKDTVTVVTDDRELRGRARQLGANTCGVNRFVEKLEKKHAPGINPRNQGSKTPRGDKPGHVSKKQVNDWMKYFGFDEDKDPLA